MAVEVTETAAREVRNIIRDQELDAENIALRVGVKGGGCSGFSYILDLTEQTRETDEVFEQTFNLSDKKAGAGEQADKAAAEGGQDEGGTATAVASGTEPFKIRIVCDPKSYLYLNGTTIDFKDEIMGRGFVFSNPNANATCGCGSSFSA